MAVGGCYGDISTASLTMRSGALLVVMGILGLLNVGDLLELAFVVCGLHEHGMPDLFLFLPCVALESAPHILQLSLRVPSVSCQSIN